MATVQVILILAVFIGGVALMMTKKMPAILALPVMGILIAAVAGVPFISGDKESSGPERQSWHPPSPSRSSAPSSPR